LTEKYIFADECKVADRFVEQIWDKCYLDNRDPEEWISEMCYIQTEIGTETMRCYTHLFTDARSY